MENKSISFLGVILGVVAIALAIFSLTSGHGISFSGTTQGFENAALGFRVNGTEVISSSRGASFTTLGTTGLVTLDGGLLLSSVNSSSTSGTAVTLAPSDVSGYNTVIITPNVASLTATLFASSSATTFLPAAGDSQRTCIVNGTTTAAVNIVLVGGTGSLLQVASSSATALGSTIIGPQKVGCITFTRANVTPTTFDILATFVSFK